MIDAEVLDRLMKCVSFYANRGNWNMNVLPDNGENARKTLADIERIIFNVQNTFEDSAIASKPKYKPQNFSVSKIEDSERVGFFDSLSNTWKTSNSTTTPSEY